MDMDIDIDIDIDISILRMERLAGIYLHGRISTIFKIYMMIIFLPETTFSTITSYLKSSTHPFSKFFCIRYTIDKSARISKYHQSTFKYSK